MKTLNLGSGRSARLARREVASETSRTLAADRNRVLAALALIAVTWVESARPQAALITIHKPPAGIELQIEGITSTTNQVQFAAALPAGTNWTVLTNLVLSSVEPVIIADGTARDASRRFYRVVTSGLPPSNPYPAELVWIPPGTFTLGSPPGEADRNLNEGPQTQVRISRGFYMSKYEVTQEQYLALMGANPSLYKSNPYAPVDTVTWQDATNYCGKLTAREQAAGRLLAGCIYRLPTEAEWEYAARAATTNRFNYGDDPGYTELSNYAWLGEGFGLPNHGVGQMNRNRWGLYDIYGNVYEWCLDWLGTYPGGSTTDPKGAATTRPGLRGGSSSSVGKECRSAARLRAWAAGESYCNAGFRVVLAWPLP